MFISILVQKYNKVSIYHPIYTEKSLNCASFQKRIRIFEAKSVKILIRVINKKTYKKAMEIKDYLTIKLIAFFIVSFLLIIFYWYFLSCFCAVYNNTQIVLIKDSLISFGVSMLYPFGINLLPGIFRIPSLRSKNKDKKCFYTISQLLSLI